MKIYGQTKIYRKDFNGRPSYSRMIASQEYKDGRKGDWIRTYENVQMPKNTNIPDGSIINVKKGFEAVFNSTKHGIMRKLVVLEYDLMDTPRPNEHDAREEQEMPPEFSALQDDDIPF